MKEHSYSCEYPEGCSCGASEFNAMESLLAGFQQEHDAFNELGERLGIPPFSSRPLIGEFELLFKQMREHSERMEKALDCATKGLWSEWELERAKYKGMEMQGLFADSSTELITHLSTQRSKLNIQLATILGFSETWNLPDTLRKLCEAVEHLKNVHMCDGDGHEQYWIALEQGKKYIERIETVLKR